MYKFEIDANWLTFEKVLKAIEVLEVEQKLKFFKNEREQKIKYLINEREHFIYVQHNWEAQLIVKLLKKESIWFDYYFIKWQIIQDL